MRRQIGVVPQSSFLFHGTVRDNIAQGRPEASTSEVERAATMAHAHEFKFRLPQGYQAVLAEQATNSSGGQRQRIAIARAILQRPRMILLDEATSALDTESERRFLQNFRRSLLRGAFNPSDVRLRGTDSYRRRRSARTRLPFAGSNGRGQEASPVLAAASAVAALWAMR